MKINFIISLLIFVIFGIVSNVHALEYTKLSTFKNNNFVRQLDIPNGQEITEHDYQYQEVNNVYENLPFSIDERIRYTIHYLGVKLGYAEVILRQPIKWGDTWAHRSTGEVRNADWYAWMVKLYDSTDTVFDNSEQMRPLRFYINQQEPINFRQSKILTFDVANKKVKQISKPKDKELIIEEFELNPLAKDAMASLYYFRTLIITHPKYQDINFPIFTSEKNWIGTAKWIKEEKIQIEGQTFDTDVYSLKTHFGSLIEQKGKLKIWVTNDDRKLPVYVEADVKFGNVKCSLLEWEQGKITSTRKKKWDKISFIKE